MVTEPFIPLSLTQEIVVTRQAELQRHSEELEQAKESRDCAWAQVGVTRTENETLKKSVADLRECVKFLQVRNSKALNFLKVVAPM